MFLKIQKLFPETSIYLKFRSENQERTTNLESEGYKVLSDSNSEVSHNFYTVYKSESGRDGTLKCKIHHCLFVGSKTLGTLNKS